MCSILARLQADKCPEEIEKRSLRTNPIAKQVKQNKGLGMKRHRGEEGVPSGKGPSCNLGKGQACI